MDNISKRQKRILEELIKEYVKKAEPVSSSFLLEKCSLDCSAATIRAEMFALEKDGYLAQPHTSAGRVPTDKAYRYFVDNLLKEKEAVLSEKDRRVIDKNIESAPRNPHAVSSRLAKTMAGLTDDFVISGIADTNEFYKVGFSNIFEMPEFEFAEDIFSFGSIFDEFENYFRSFFNKLPENDILVYIGRENPNRETSKETVMVVRYPLPEGYDGVSALIGPMRMAYERNMAILKYVAKKMNQFK